MTRRPRPASALRPLSRTDPVDFRVEKAPAELLEVVCGCRILCLPEEEPQAALPSSTHAVRDHRGLDPASAELAQDTLVPESRDRTHVEQHPRGGGDARDTPEIGAQRSAVRPPPHERLDDPAEPRAALFEARVRDACVLRGVFGAHALHGEIVDLANARQGAAVVAVDVLVGPPLPPLAAAPQQTPPRAPRRAPCHPHAPRTGPVPATAPPAVH